MKLLANENVPRIAVHALRAVGHDVVWARTDMAGAADEQIIARAEIESRVIVTFDKDFGELVYRRGLPASCGVVLFRFTITAPELAADRATRALQSRSDGVGHFAVVEEARIRLRPLPEPPGSNARD